MPERSALLQFIRCFLSVRVEPDAGLYNHNNNSGSLIPGCKCFCYRNYFKRACMHTYIIIAQTTYCYRHTIANYGNSYIDLLG